MNKTIKAYQLSSLGVPLKHLGLTEFTPEAWDRLMAFYKSRGRKPRWKKVPEVKPKEEKNEEKRSRT